MSAATQVSYILSPQGKNTTEAPTFILHDPEYTASGMGVVFTAPGSSDAHFMKSRTRAASGVAAAHKMYSRYSAQKITPSATGRSRALIGGKVAVPKTALLKVMAATGLTFLLGECNTSKMCPCGTDELITPEGGANDKRVRVHKTSRGRLFCATTG